MNEDNISFCNLHTIKSLLNKDDIIIITDENIVKFYPEFFSDIVEKCIIISDKSFENFQKTITELVKRQAYKNTILYGIGGGEVTDFTGFIASIYMRGIQFNFVPTTLLAMVDAAIGGKNAINFAGIKNILGLINDAKNIYISTSFLDTLPHKEMKNGFVEIIKIALLKDKELLLKTFEYIKSNSNNKELLKEIIRDSISLKMQIVNEDKFDKGKRNILNFGHTIGHALETTYNITHGEAVLCGMYYESKIAEKIGLIDNRTFGEIDYYLRVFSEDFEKYEIKNCIEKIYFDKKNISGFINFPYVNSVGLGDLQKIDTVKFIDAISSIT